MNVKVTGEYGSELEIKLLQGTWHTIIYLLFGDMNVRPATFPKEPSLFTLAIRYDDSNYYYEKVVFPGDPNRENLSFHFYKEGRRVFCKVKSDFAMELDKEVVLNPLPDRLKAAMDVSKEFTDD